MCDVGEEVDVDGIRFSEDAHLQLLNYKKFKTMRRLITPWEKYRLERTFVYKIKDKEHNIVITPGYKKLFKRYYEGLDLEI